jgi:hypothetical protein
MIAIKDTALACCKYRYVKLISTFGSVFSNWNVDSALRIRFEALQGHGLERVVHFVIL